MEMKNGKWKMKNRRYINITMGFVAICILFLSCSEREEGIAQTEEAALRISPAVGDLIDINTRAANDFFEVGDEIRVTVTNSSGEVEELTYIYDADGIFNGNPGYNFPLDDSYIKNLVAEWPADVPEGGAFEADQREYENYRRADWLVASASASGIMATNTPVPLFFEHNNCLLEFELVGQNTNGLRIKELLIQLEVDGVPTACWAYCGNQNGRASFLLKNGTILSSQEGLLIGTIPGESDDRYTIILPDINLVLESGMRYLVTLTPRGYDMDIFTFIGTFSAPSDERGTGIGVPFQLPEDGQEGDYIIHTGIELVTVSYVVRHYTDGSTPNYPSSTYVLADDFVLTGEAAALYIPMPRSLFTGQIIYQGVPVDSLPYGNGEVLQLFTNN